MLEESTEYSRELINQAQQLMAEYFDKKSIHFSKVIQLSEPDRRNLILRLIINEPAGGIPRSVILKKTVTEKRIFENSEEETEIEQFSRFAHDWAGLQFLTELNNKCAPFFYAGNLENKFILIEDLGVEHDSLVDPLTRANSTSNVQRAEIALIGYMKKLGKMHADTAMKSQQFQTILKHIYPDAHRLYLPEPSIPHVILQFKLLANHELEELKKEIEDVLTFSLASNEFNTLLHGDICPDNVFYKNKETHFIDFEYGDFGNALIDGVYLRMSMPSCWCSKSVPITVINQMETVYRGELKKGISAAGDDLIYFKQLIYACAYWTIRTINQIADMDLLDHEWVCPSGPVKPDSKWAPDKNTFRPRILSRLQAFITASSCSEHLPKLSKTSKLLLNRLKKLWPETNFIEVFTVFNEKNI